MKRVFLVMVVSAMLVTLGLAQTPDAGGNMDPADVKGCLGGSEGNYTVVEDGTGQLFKITSSSADLKTHLGHDVKLTGHKATGAASNSFAATEVSMISEHCAAAAAPIAAAVTPSPEPVIAPDPAAAAPATASAPAAPVNPPSATASAPVVDPAAPAATVSPSAATTSTPAVAAAAPAATVNPAPAPTSPPAVEAAAPPTTVSPSAATVTSPAVEAAPAKRPSAHARKLVAKQPAANNASDATVSPSSDTVTPAAQDAAAATTAAPSPQTVSPPDAAAVAPAPTVTHRAGSLTLLISFVVLVIVLGTLVPLLGRWRKRKILERTGTPNLSFINEANSDRDKPKPRKVA